MADLASRVQALPGELFNQILDYTTLSCEDDEIDLDHGLITRPIGLQINHTIRFVAMQEYYSNTIFRFNDLGACVVWLHSMTVEQRRLLWQLRYTLKEALQRCRLTPSKVLDRAHGFSRETAIPLADIVFVKVNVAGPMEWRNRAGLSQMP